MENPSTLERVVNYDSPDKSSDRASEIPASLVPVMAQPLTVATLMSYAGITTVSEFARRAHVSRNTVYRWMRSGLNIYTADELAILVAHVHPASVFGDAWFSAHTDAAAA